MHRHRPHSYQSAVIFEPNFTSIRVIAINQWTPSFRHLVNRDCLPMMNLFGQLAWHATDHHCRSDSILLSRRLSWLTVLGYITLINEPATKADHAKVVPRLWPERADSRSLLHPNMTLLESHIWLRTNRSYLEAMLRWTTLIESLTQLLVKIWFVKGLWFGSKFKHWWSKFNTSLE